MTAALVQVLLARRYNIRPSLQSFKIDAAVDSVQADAVLMIGDRAMNIDTSAYVADWDLGEEWTRETGLPFVFAMWVAAGPQIPAEVSQALQLVYVTG